ncbi:MAG: hypothetical protein EZS28_007942 [Streblomastix strix]|uniref:Uncharacterized protein n=1 Tax=Streblomastix strix TaxID=222440 RepID=A0A5J4WNW2_9EUKA|nr:MAG: hypothetical protein EZS28_007942 [Streblomastix strix]
MRAPTTILTHLDLDDYKRFIRNHINQMQEKTILDTKKKIVGIFSIMIQVFRLSHAGAGKRTISSLKNQIMRRGIRYIDPEKINLNLCFFLAYSVITMPDIKADGSAIASKRYKEHSSRKAIDANKYEDQTIPQHYEIPVIGFNSSNSNAKYVVDKHNITGIRLRFVDAMIYCTKMKLYQFIKDFTPKTTETTSTSNVNELNQSLTPTKLKFPDEFINYENYNEILNNPQPFPIEAQDYLRHYNLEDTRLMIQPLDYLIDMFFNYKIDMLQFKSMSEGANAIKMLLLIAISNWIKITCQKMIMLYLCLHLVIRTLKFKIIWKKIKKEIETQATISRNQIMRSTENYFYPQDAIYLKHDSQAKFLKHQIESTTTGAIQQIT